MGKIKVSVAQQRKQDKQQAMPKVKALVKQYGRSVVQSCINELRDYERTLREIKEKKAELAELERKVG